jgi:aarF domain-containing kinase
VLAREMSILNAQVNPAMAKNIMYLCMAAPALAFGLRMAKSAIECVPPRDRASRRMRSFARATAIRVQPSVALASRLTLSPAPSIADLSRSAPPPPRGDRLLSTRERARRDVGSPRARRTLLAFGRHPPPLAAATMSAARARLLAATGLLGGSAAFARWDATDTRGGVGFTRAARATATAARIVVDYKWSLAGLEKDSPPFHDARHGVHERSAARLLALCERNGGLYTKAGQFISTASGMPLPFQQQLSKLQDSAAPLDFRDVRRVVAEELGPEVFDERTDFLDGGRDDGPEPSEPSERSSTRRDRSGSPSNVTVDETVHDSPRRFAAFDREPVAAASLAQVHRAVTASGDEVAVKVQRPGLRRQFDADLATMRFITRSVLLAFPLFDFSFLVPEFEKRLARELDFAWEGRSCERAGRALADDPRVVTPGVHWPLTSSKVLTMEYVRGVKVDDGPGLRAAGIDPRDAAAALADAFARTLLCHGFAHGDPHPGNVLVRRLPPKESNIHRFFARTRRDRDLGSDVDRGGDRGPVLLRPVLRPVLALSDSVSAALDALVAILASPLDFFFLGLGGGGSRVGPAQIVLLDHGLYTELTEPERRRMCRMWHAVAMRDPALVRAVSVEMGVPESLRWVLPQLMARQTSQVAPIGTTKEREAAGRIQADPRSAEAAAARVDGIIRGGRPPMTIDQVSEFGRSLPREMMVVMRSNALIRNITRKLAKDEDEYARARMENLRKRAASAAGCRRGRSSRPSPSPPPPRSRRECSNGPSRSSARGAGRWGSARGGSSAGTSGGGWTGAGSGRWRASRASASPCRGR